MEGSVIRALIDGDILVYEVGSAGQYKDEKTGELVMSDFDTMVGYFQEKVKQIEAEVWATEPSVLYLGGNETLIKSLNKQNKREGVPEVEYAKNFRCDVAKSRPYKGNRKAPKPLHYDNLRQWIVANYKCKVAVGCEVDDLLCSDLYKSHLNGQLDCIACSRDKDLKMVPGMHFGWECGRQPQFGPKRVTELGSVGITNGRRKLFGDGGLFFYAQMLIGDSVDNIEGCKGCGPVAAYEAIMPATTLNEAFQAVANKYREVYGNNWVDKFTENANLLWIVREFNEDGTPVLFQMPENWEKLVGTTGGEAVQV